MLLVSWDGLFYRRFALIGYGAWNTGLARSWGEISRKKSCKISRLAALWETCEISCLEALRDGLSCISQNHCIYHRDLARLNSSSIGHPPLSSASPVKLRLRVGPRALSVSEKKELENKGWRTLSVRLSVRNAPKENKLGVNKYGIMYRVRYLFGTY